MTRRAGARADRPVRLKQPFVLVVWLATLVAAAVMLLAVRAMIVHGNSAKTLGWTAQSVGLTIVVSDVDPEGPAAGKLVIGDRLISLNDDRSVSQVGPIYHWLELERGAPYSVSVEREGTELELELLVGSRASNRSFWLALGVFWTAMGLFIGFAKPDRTSARLAFTAAVLTGVWFLNVTITRPTVLVTLWPLHTIAGFHFFYRFPERAPKSRWWTGVLAGLYLGGLLAVVLGQPSNWAFFTKGAAAATELWAEHPELIAFRYRLSLVLFFASIAAIILVIPRNYIEVTNADARRRLRWLGLGSILGIAPQLWWASVGLLETVVGPLGLPRMSFVVNGFTLLIPITLTVVILKHRLFDIRVVIRRGLQYLLARRALQLVLWLPLAILAVTLVVQRDSSVSEIVVGNTGYLVWAAVAAIGFANRERLVRGLDRRFFREQYDREQLLVALVDERQPFDLQ